MSYFYFYKKEMSMKMEEEAERKWERGDFFVVPNKVGERTREKANGFGIMIGRVTAAFVPNAYFFSPDEHRQITVPSNAVFIPEEEIEGNIPETAWVLLRMAITATRGFL